MIAILVILAFVAAWNIAPMLMLCTLPIPWRHKLRGCKSFANAALRGLLVLPPDLLAPVVVPFALRQIGWGAESLATLGALVGQRRQYQRRSSSPRHTCRHARGRAALLLRAGPPPAPSAPDGSGWACATGPVRSPQCLAASSRPLKFRTRTPGATKPSAKAKEGWCVPQRASVPALHHPQDRPAVPACALRPQAQPRPHLGPPGNGGQHQL